MDGRACYIIIRQIEYQMPAVLLRGYLTPEAAAAAIEALEDMPVRIAADRYTGRRCEYRIQKIIIDE